MVGKQSCRGSIHLNALTWAGTCVKKPKIGRRRGRCVQKPKISRAAPRHLLSGRGVCRRCFKRYYPSRPTFAFRLRHPSKIAHFIKPRIASHLRHPSTNESTLQANPRFDFLAPILDSQGRSGTSATGENACTLRASDPSEM